MKKSFLLVCSSLVLLFASCSKKSDPIEIPVGEAKVRYVNALYGSAAQDLYINGIKKNTSPVAYGSFSEFYTISSGASALKFNDAGSATSNFTLDNGGFNIGDKISIFYYKKTDGFIALAYLTDNVTTVPAGKANVRFLNINSSLNNQIAINNVGAPSPVVPSLTYFGLSAYFPVDAAAKFTFTANGVTNSPVFDGIIVAGKSYTIWIDGATSADLTGHIIEHN